MNARPSRRRGQGMTEYILIVSLVAIATIGIVSLFGDNVRRLFAMSADALAGGDNIRNANQANAVANGQLTRKKLREFAMFNDPY